MWIVIVTSSLAYHGPSYEKSVLLFNVISANYPEIRIRPSTFPLICLKMPELPWDTPSNFPGDLSKNEIVFLCMSQIAIDQSELSFKDSKAISFDDWEDNIVYMNHACLLVFFQRLHACLFVFFQRSHACILVIFEWLRRIRYRCCWMTEKKMNSAWITRTFFLALGIYHEIRTLLSVSDAPVSSYFPDCVRKTIRMVHSSLDRFLCRVLLIGFALARFDRYVLWRMKYVDCLLGLL